MRQELQQYGHYDLWRQLAAIPRPNVAWAIALTLLNCLVFTGYDTLAARYVHYALPYRQTALASITSIAISNSVGLGILTGSAIRYRFYQPWGVPPLKIAQMIGFCNLSFWLGLFTVGGFLFLWQPFEIPARLHLPFPTTRPIGVLFLGMISTYLLWNLYSKKTLKLGRITIPNLPINLCLGQIIISSLDWTLAATVLYALLPAPVSVPYFTYLGIYLLAQFAGLVSNIPGGLGVFETVMLLLLAPAISGNILFSSLVAYRAVYYLLPLTMAVLLILAYEIRSRWSCK